MMSWGKHMTDHQQVVFTLKLDHTTAFQQSALVGFALEQLTMGTFDDVCQIGLQLYHLACTIDHINAVVLVEEQRGIVEMTHTGM